MTTSEGAARRSTPPPAPPTTDNAAELVSAMTQARPVFEGHKDAQDALDYLQAVLDAGAAPAAAPAAEPAPIVTKLAIDIDTSAIDAAMAKLEALKTSAAEARAAFSPEPGAVPIGEFERLITAAHAATDLAEQQIKRAERATAATMDLARQCQQQEEQIASLIAALGALAARA